jgi:hypothetical protein
MCRCGQVVNPATLKAQRAGELYTLPATRRNENAVRRRPQPVQSRASAATAGTRAPGGACEGGSARAAMDAETREKLAELSHLEHAIGKAGVVALRPLLMATGKEVWQLSLLRQ